MARKWDQTKRGRAYNVWNNMMHKCYDKKHMNYAYYGGRGITVVKRWHDFERFYADMGPAPSGLTLERKNNALGYSPANCLWATRKEQARNRRSNRVLTYGGATQCLMAWAHQTGLDRRTIARRIDVLGWPTERALTEAVR